MVGLVTGVIVALIFWLAFYIISIFMNFVDDMLGAYRLEDINYPIADKIRTYFIVILVLLIIGYIIGYSTLSNLSNYAELFEGTMYEGIAIEDYTFDAWDILYSLFSVAQIAFIIYYTKQYDIFAVEANIRNKENLRRFEESKEIE